MPVIALLFALFAVLSPAHAEEPAAETSDMQKQLDKVDAFFGKNVVGPMAKVIFFDVMFWDDTLAPGKGIGQMVGDEKITGHSAAGYAYQKQWSGSAGDIVPVLDGPLNKTYNGVKVKIFEAKDAEGNPMLGAQVVPQPARLKKWGLAPAEATEPGADSGGKPPEETFLKTVTGIAPFDFMVDTRSASVLSTEIPVPADAIPTVAGMKVWKDGVRATLVSVEGDQATFLADKVRTDKTPLPNPDQAAFPAVVVWLVLGAVFFTLRMQFINIRAFFHALVVTAGRYDDPDDPGEISHFQALSSALSATVGLGNIAGVAIAISQGGPGAIFWMWVAAILGMSSKFVECTLGQMYRVERPDGSVSGGPMHYLEDGLRELGLGPLGKVLAVLFAVMCIGGSLGGGNMFQANQSYAQAAEVMPLFADYSILYGVLLAFCVGLVIIGGIKRIGLAASLIVPIMCGIYVLGAIAVLVANASAVPAAFASIVREAFTPMAGFGGLIGVLAVGFKRASFSNEAGIGSASIAHSAAATKEPVREGIVALLEPFIDTIVVCTMTGLVVVVTGAYKIEGIDGVVMTSTAFGSVFEWFPIILSFAVIMFAFSTMISWSYYGERCAVWLFGDRAALPYKIIFLLAVVLGSVIKLGSVIDFSDMMVLGMAAPNILGAVILSGKVKRATDEYMRKLKAGEFTMH